MNLRPLYIRSIVDLILIFDTLIDACLSGRSVLVSPDTIKQATASCNVLLQQTQLSRSDSLSDPGAYWLRTAYIVDLVILMYTAGHTGYIPGDLDTPEFYHDFPFSGNFSLISREEVSLRSMSCLDPLLKCRKVWVLTPVYTPAATDHFVSEVAPELYLSTDIVTFSDIWGPAWEVYNEDKTDVLQYSVGNGSIIPWESENHPDLVQGERLCHWIPFTLMEEELEIRMHQAEMIDYVDDDSWSVSSHSSVSSSSSETELVTSDDIGNVDLFPSSIEQKLQWVAFARANPLPSASIAVLLIGAKTGLHRSECRCSRRKFRRRLTETRCIHPLGTHKRSSYIDSRSIGISAAYQGVGTKNDMTIKSDHRYYKQVLLERWEHFPKIRYPKSLRYLGGIVLSICTMNAQRCPISVLLSASSIRRLLEPFPWSDDECKTQFWHSVMLKDPETLVSLWDLHPQWHDELGEVLLLCLKHLERTGFDTQQREFNALWVYSSGHLPERIILKPEKYSWVQVLRDSLDSCAMAVFSEDCLGITSYHQPQQLCKHLCSRQNRISAPSTVETAIEVNSQIPPFERSIYKRVIQRNGDRERAWDVSNNAKHSALDDGAKV